MTFTQIYTECTNLRFNTATIKLAQVKNWVNQAEIQLWNAADWQFRRVPMANMTVTAGAAVEPADFGKAISLVDPRGDEVTYLDPNTFEENYTAPVPAPTGTAEAFTVINRQIIVGPAETGTFKLSYRRRYAHFNAADATVVGTMTVDSDYPVWDSQHHYILVPWAIRIGKLLEDDPTASLLDQVIMGMRETSMFRAMVEDLAMPGVEQQVEVWSAAG